MSDWVVSNISNNEEVSSILPSSPAPTGSVGVSPQSKDKTSSIGSDDYGSKKDSITHLGSSYRIKDVTVSGAKSHFPSWLIALLVLAPIIFIFIISIVSNKENKKPEVSFLFKTLESKYFTLNYSPDYDLTSIVDKKVPFIEKHDLASIIGGQKIIQILVKDVKFDYSVDSSASVKLRRQDPNLYSEENYELNYKQGLYFKKVGENFEHFIILVDRSKSLLLEILISSPSNFADNEDMQQEVKDMLDSFTFL